MGRRARLHRVTGRVHRAAGADPAGRRRAGQGGHRPDGPRRAACRARSRSTRLRAGLPHRRDQAGGGLPAHRPGDRPLGRGVGGAVRALVRRAGHRGEQG
ncbi:hypothetical protein [Nocardioides convexus]|uniref:hypothetical protein n=1 Tax=Nocardioides convexus TaxID=2712224 RepID=UPI0024182EDB|nr:hypothetical protein [Nocardioides convexus]